jgi:hypothetical protein
MNITTSTGLPKKIPVAASNKGLFEQGFSRGNK